MARITHNSQVGVYLGYVSRQGYTLADSHLFLPEAWFDDDQADRRKQCGVPADVVFKTQPSLGLELVQRAVPRDALPFRWVAADALYGDAPAFRDGVADLGKWSFTEVACSTPVWRRRPAVVLPRSAGRGPHPKRLRLRTPSHRPVRVDELVRRLPTAAWVRCKIKEGSKGPLVCDFAFLLITEARQNLSGPTLWLVIRRNVDDPTVLKFYLSNAPADIGLSELVRISGLRWPIETPFEEGKGEVGLDQYETRSWAGWHHQMLLVSLAHHFLVRLRVQLKEQAPALTLSQVPLLLLIVVPKPNFEAADETPAEIAERFDLSKSTVEKWWHRWQATDSCAALPPGHGATRMLQVCAAFIRAEIARQPDVTLVELCERVTARDRVSASVSAMGRTVQLLGLPRKKKTLHDRQRDTPRVKTLRQDFVVHVQTELSDLLSHLQFIDESGLHLGFTRLDGRAAPGERVTEGTPDYSGPHYTTIAAIGLRGVSAPWLFEGAMTTLAFET